MDQELLGRGHGPGFLHARVDPQAGPVGHRFRVRPEVGWVAPLALQAFDAALQGHGLTFPVRSSTVTAHVPNSTIQVPAPM